MRSRNTVNALESIRTFVATLRTVHALHLRATLFIVAVVAATALATHARADELPKPRIVDFSVSFDGFDQYYVTGTVVDLENVDYLTVEFGDILSGNTVQTNPDGTFGLLVWIYHAEYETFSATVTSHEGVVSDRASYWIN